MPREYRAQRAETASHLAQYCEHFNCVEINSSFRHNHHFETYERWAATVPADFGFAVKVPAAVTHERKLQRVSRELDQFASGVGGLGSKLHVLLMQLPPSVEFDARRTRSAVHRLQNQTVASVACEPRHASWFTPRAERLLADWNVTRVAADPAKSGISLVPGGAPTIAYLRLHGSPRTYYSKYDPAFLQRIADIVMSRASMSLTTWVVFDNTAAGAAWPNALELCKLLPAL